LKLPIYKRRRPNAALSRLMKKSVLRPQSVSPVQSTPPLLLGAGIWA
jgi:hypothetical protein